MTRRPTVDDWTNANPNEEDVALQLFRKREGISQNVVEHSDTDHLIITTARSVKSTFIDPTLINIVPEHEFVRDCGRDVCCKDSSKRSNSYDVKHTFQLTSAILRPAFPVAHWLVSKRDTVDAMHTHMSQQRTSSGLVARITVI